MHCGCHFGFLSTKVGKTCRDINFQSFSATKLNVNIHFYFFNNLFPVFSTVTENALLKLIDKLPKKFDKKAEDYAQKSVYKKKSRANKSKHRNQITKHLH